MFAQSSLCVGMQVGERCIYDLGALLFLRDPYLFAPSHAIAGLVRSFQLCCWLIRNVGALQAQLGLRHPLVGVEEGWAWVNINATGEGRDGGAAHAMSDFVARTLVQLEAEGQAGEDRTYGANRTLPSIIEQNPQLGAPSCSQ